MFFTPEFFIDTFQNTKKAVANSVFQDKTLNKAAHAYIDAQTVFAKVLANNSIEMTRYSVDSVSSILFPKSDNNINSNEVQKSQSKQSHSTVHNYDTL